MGEGCRRGRGGKKGVGGGGVGEGCRRGRGGKKGVGGGGVGGRV